MADTARWQRFAFRRDDIVITTPMKCGTTWTQQIVAMLTSDSAEPEAPLAQLSPWLDSMIDTEESVFAHLEHQEHRRFIKTHAPLDGIPLRRDVSYIAVVRHPLDVALSMRDHGANVDGEQVVALRTAANGQFTFPDEERPPEDDAEYLRWWVHNDLEPDGNGPRGLADLCHQVTTYWLRRREPNVHLFHYGDLSDDLSGEIRILAAAIGVDLEDDRLARVSAAASLDSMRRNADTTVPFRDREIWQSPEGFFAQGGDRAWAPILDADDLDRFHRRGRELSGDAWPWVIGGRTASDADGAEVEGRQV